MNIGPYETFDEIGVGNNTTVYRAMDTRTARAVALKVLPTRYLRDHTLYARLMREKELLQLAETHAILHPLEIGEADGYFYICMPWLTGGSLDTLLTEGPLDVKEAKEILHQLAEALDASHRVGVLHQDIKPTNILFDESGTVYLADFGAVKLALASAPVDKPLLVGPVAYLSPESSLVPENVGTRSDLYSLGALFFEMLTGEPPFHAPTNLGVTAQNAAAPIPDILTFRPDLPKQFRIVFEKALAKDPNDRYATAGEMVEAVEAATIKKLKAPHRKKEQPVSYLPLENYLQMATELSRRPSSVTTSRSKRRQVTAFLLVLPIFLLIAAGTWVGMNKPEEVQRALAQLSLMLTPTGSPDSPTSILVNSVTPSPLPEPTQSASQSTATEVPTPSLTPIPTTPPTATPPQPSATQEVFSPTPTWDRPDTYVVQPNDSLFNIASQFDVDLEYLMGLNGLSCTSQVYSGKILNIPGEGISSSPGSVAPISDNNVSQIKLLRILDCMKKVRDLNFSPAGNLLAVAQDSYVYIWRTGNWKPHIRLKGHQGLIQEVTFSPDGTILASAADDFTIRLWSVDNGSLLKTISGHRSSITGLAFSPDGKSIASSSLDQTVRIWQVPDGKITQELRGYPAHSVAYSPDGKYFAVGYVDSVSLYHAPNGGLIWTLPSKTVVADLTFSPNSLLLASAKAVWHVTDEKLLYELRQSGETDKIVFSLDSRLLFVGRRAFSMVNGSFITKLSSPVDETPRTSYAVEVATLNSPGNILVWGTQDGLSIWAIEGDSVAGQTPGEPYTLEKGDNLFNVAEKYNVNLPAFLELNGLTCTNEPYTGQPLLIPEGEKAVPAPGDLNLSPINAANAGAFSKILEVDTSCSAQLTTPNFSKNGELLISGDTVWDITRNSILIQEKNANIQVDSVSGNTMVSPILIFSPDGNIVLGRSGNEIHMWEALTGRFVRALKAHTHSVTGIAYSPDGTLFTSGGGTAEKIINVWQANGSLKTTFHSYSAKNLWITPDNSLLIGGWDTSIRFWNIKTRELITTVNGLIAPILITGDGQYMAYLSCATGQEEGCTNRLVTLFYPDRQAVYRSFVGMTSDIQTIAFSPDSTMIAGGSGPTTTVWNISTGNILHTLRADTSTLAPVTQVLFSPDNQLLFTGDGQGVHVWDLKSGELIHSISVRSPDGISISPDGKILAVLKGNAISLWGIVDN